MADIDEAVDLARRCLDVGGTDYNACDLNTLARAVLAMADVVAAARAQAAAHERNDWERATNRTEDAIRTLDAEPRQDPHRVCEACAAWQRLAEAEARDHLATTQHLIETEAALAAARAALRHQPHEPPGRTAYVVSLEDAIGALRAWAASRIAHCAAIEAKYLNTSRYDIPLEPVEARQEKRTLEAVLRVLDEKAAPT